MPRWGLPPLPLLLLLLPQCISVRGVKSASVDVEGSEAPKAPRAVAKKVLAMREAKALRQLEVGCCLRRLHGLWVERELFACVR